MNYYVLGFSYGGVLLLSVGLQALFVLSMALKEGFKYLKQVKGGQKLKRRGSDKKALELGMVAPIVKVDGELEVVKSISPSERNADELTAHDEVPETPKL